VSHRRGHESGVAIDIRQADVFELRNGRVIRVTLGYAGTDDALGAVGARSERD